MLKNADGADADEPNLCIVQINAGRPVFDASLVFFRLQDQVRAKSYREALQQPVDLGEAVCRAAIDGAK